MEEEIELLGSEPEQKKVKPRKKKWILWIMILGILIIGCLGTAVILFSKPKVIFQKSYDYLTKAFATLETSNTLQEQMSKNDRIKYESNMSLKFNKKLGLDIEDIQLTLEILEDITAKQSQIYMDSKIDNQQLIELIAYLKDNKIYMTLSDIMDKYYYTNQEYISSKNSLNEKDIEVLFNTIANSIKKVITDDKFKKDKQTTEIDGQNIKCTRISLDVTDTLLKDIITTFTNDLKSDEQSLKVVMNITGKTKEEIITIIEEFKEEIKDTKKGVLFTYNIYYKNLNTIQKIEIVSEDEVLSYTANNGNYHIWYLEDGDKILDFMIEDKKPNATLKLIVEDIIITGEYIPKSNTSELSLKLMDEKSQELANMTLKIVEKSDVEEELEITVGYQGTNILTLTANNKFTFGESINLPDLTTTKPIEEISEEEVQEMLLKLEKHPVIGPLFSLIYNPNPEIDDEEYKNAYTEEEYSNIYEYGAFDSY